MKFASLVVYVVLPCFVNADRETAFNINSVSCNTNSAALSYASCGYGGADPCAIGDEVNLQGTYTIQKSIPQNVEVCGKVQVFGIGVYDAGCKDIDICDYVDCSNTGTDGYLDGNGSPYSYDIDVKEIPGKSGWFGSGYGFGFAVTVLDDGTQVEKCKVNVSTTTISTSAAVVAVASLCAAAAAIYYRKKRRTGTIDLEKEESLVQTDFVELSKSGVSV